MRIAIIVHAFYPQLWPEVAKCVRSFSVYAHDVFVTLPENATEMFEEAIRQDFPNADIKKLQNRGFDVGPFVEVLRRIDIEQYDYIVKLHTKRDRFGVVNFMPLFGGQWRRKLYAFCRTPQDVNRCLELFSAEPQVGMVGCGELIVRPWDEMVREPETRNDADHRAFVAGTMFVVRAHLMKAVLEVIAFDDFGLTARNQTTSLAHVWERRLGYVVSEQGCCVAAYPKVGVCYKLARPILAWLYRQFFQCHCVVCP